MLKTMYITNDPKVALIAQKYGVDRIWIDLETLGKEERQKNMNTVKSKHTIEDIKKLRPFLKKSELLVRVNPININSQREIDAVIKNGADIIMLPMWKTLEEVKKFLEYVDGRVKTTLLLETKEGVEILEEILSMKAVDEIHIGLNDLHLSYGMKFMFEPLANGIVEEICNKIRKFNIPYGFGGVAQIGEGLLPAENIILEHYRLGSTRVILSRSFCNTEMLKNIDEIERIFSTNICKMKEFEKKISGIEEQRFIENKLKTENMIKEIVKSRR
ncbi:hypothetical protein IX317_000581 [Fusobacterium sp. DD29]|uniref:aldolase/citrate lyase family protein n=1 Tax=unclassified Fusobacterium TaxID=2648384 RepID=UPI001E0CA20E|nr:MULTISPECIES: aldolase/citrate lyase family protein [unclassified Fusobacterium]MBR8700680.1 hypothetical protein [Fusobacterium sp. DD45]MBR8710771.1 hypothetical protein [Fusobacterium sp. DD28]MBR8748920.1 hypothetical protein [Fusobacterium sp. DD29]MBR8751379.1 hypothetical protein [Fusobacterium sp. DD26]MBR8761178.1 hypothetical protein [Fusobacterium sp. DD25]